jgi:tetratricopeptide (TPR) repeat protein
MENYVSEAQIPVEKCLNDVAGCDLYIGLFAWRYGQVQENSGRSITELEYRTAVDRRIPVLIFLLHEEVPWLPKHVDSGDGIKKLRQELESKHLVSHFKSPHHLAALVTAAVALHAEIRAGGNARTMAVQPGSPATGPVVVGLRPADGGDSFKGRERELRQLREWLESPAVRLICVTGRGGMGKTALVSQLCMELEEEGGRDSLRASGGFRADAIVHVSCREKGQPSVEQLLQSFSLAIDSAGGQQLRECLQDPSRTLQQKIQELLSQLQTGCYLLVLDELEHTLASDGSVALPGLREFLELALTTRHGIRVLASSRERLAINPAGMRAVRTLLLDHGLPETDGAAFLRDLDPVGELGLREASVDLLQEASRVCYGIPRALESIVGILANEPTLSLDQFLSDKALFQGKVLENLIAEHYRLITPRERTVLEALAVLNRPASETAIRYLLLPEGEADVRSCLHSLVQDSSVKHSRKLGTFELHPLDQQFLYESLPLHVEGGMSRQLLHRRAASYFESIPVSETSTEISDIESQLEARRHFFLAGEYEKAGDIAAARARSLIRCGHYTLAENILDDTASTAHGYALAAAYLGKASIAALRNQWSQALQCNRRAVETLEQLPEEREQTLLGVAVVNTAYAHCRLTQFEAVERVCQQGLRIATHLRNPWLEGKCLSIMALAALLQGEYDRVLELGQKSLALHRSIPLKEAGTTPAHTLDILGIAHLAREDPNSAMRVFQESLEMRESLKTHLGLGHSYHNLGLASLALGNADEALRYLQISLDVRQRIRHEEGIAETLCSTAEAYQCLHREDQATAFFERAREVLDRQAEGMDVVRTRYFMGYGSLLFQQGKQPEAQRSLEEAFRLADISRLGPEQAKCAYLLAACYAQQDDAALARSWNEKALALAQAFSSSLVKPCEDLLGQLQLSKAATRNVQN